MNEENVNLKNKLHTRVQSSTHLIRFLALK